MNRSHIHVTRTGVQIGGHYIPPPQPMGDQAQIIQAALLAPDQQEQPGRFERVLDWLDAHWIVLLVASAAIGGVFAEVVK